MKEVRESQFKQKRQGDPINNCDHIELIISCTLLYLIKSNATIPAPVFHASIFKLFRFVLLHTLFRHHDDDPL